MIDPVPRPSPASRERTALEERVRRLGPWFHNIDLRGVRTAPDHFLGDYPALKWRQFADAIPPDLAGATVLDVGCNGGFYTFEMKRRGAGRVVGIDWDAVYLEQARFAAHVLELDVEFRQLSVYEVATLGERFDYVLFMGVFYHLRHPLLALDLLHEHVVGDVLVFQSMQRGPDEQWLPADDYPFSEHEVFERPGFPRMSFVERKYAGDPTNWWIPNRSAVEGILRSSGYDILGRPESEVYICRRRPLPQGTLAVYPPKGPPRG